MNSKLKFSFLIFFIFLILFSACVQQSQNKEGQTGEQSKEIGDDSTPPVGDEGKSVVPVKEDGEQTETDDEKTGTESEEKEGETESGVKETDEEKTEISGATGIIASSYSEYATDDFYISYPATWKTGQSGSETQFSGGGKFFALGPQIKVISVEGALKEIKEIFGSVYENFEAEQENAVQLPYNGTKFIYSFSKENEQYTSVAVIFVMHRFGYVLYGEALENEFQNALSLFEKMISSFKIKNIPTLSYDAWPSKTSQHFIFYYPAESNAGEDISEIVSEHETGFSNIITALNISFNEKINFYLYSSETLLYQMTRRNSGFAIAEEKEVHSLYVSKDERQSIGHEMTHVITFYALGEPKEALFGEGIAVFFDQNPEEKHELAALLLLSEELPSLESFSGDSWFDMKPEIAYSASGSFVKFVIEKYGADKFKQIYSKNLSDAAKSLGTDVVALEKEWHTALESSESDYFDEDIEEDDEEYADEEDYAEEDEE